MKKFITIIIMMIVVIFGATTSHSETYDLVPMTGTIGKYAIVMDLIINTSTGKATGWYYYKSKGSKNKIQLSGKVYGDPVLDFVKLNLTETVNGKTTGNFTGDLWISAVGNQGYEGTWSSPSGKKLTFSVDYFRP